MTGPSDTDRAAAAIAAKAGGLPLRVVGFHPQADDNGEFTLYVQRSSLELKPLEVRAHPAILKQIVGLLIIAEGQKDFAPIGIGS